MLRSCPMRKDIKDTHIYFPVKVLERLRKLAAANRRSLSAEIVIAVEKHVGDAGGKRVKR